jgi:uncharacterized RDD family membrane protein YckC
MQHYNLKRLDAGTRLGTMFLDHMTMSFVLTIVVAPGLILDMAENFAHSPAQPRIFMGNYYLNIFAFSLYFNKDIYLGRSLGKRILKLQLIDIKTNQPASALKCFIRNLTIIAWPIEGIVALVNNERRIGDFIAGTKLIPFDPEQHNTQPNWILMLVALIASMAFTYLALFLPFEIFLRTRGLL